MVQNEVILWNNRISCTYYTIFSYVHICTLPKHNCIIRSLLLVFLHSQSVHMYVSLSTHPCLVRLWFQMIKSGKQLSLVYIWRFIAPRCRIRQWLVYVKINKKYRQSYLVYWLWLLCVYICNLLATTVFVQEKYRLWDECTIDDSYYSWWWKDVVDKQIGLYDMKWGAFDHASRLISCNYNVCTCARLSVNVFVFLHVKALFMFLSQMINCLCTVVRACNLS